jgi:hypothetical protein
MNNRFFIAQICIGGTRIDVARPTCIAFDAEVVLRSHCDVKVTISTFSRKFLVI